MFEKGYLEMTTTREEGASSIGREEGALTKFQARPAWGILALLVLFMLVNYADRTVLALAGQPLMDELKISPSQFGFISSSFYFLYSLSAVALGIVASKVPVKWFLAGLTAFWALTQLPIFLFASVGVILASRIALGAAEGPATAVSHSTAYSWFPPSKRGLPATLLSAGPALSQIVVAPILTLIMVWAGWRSGFLVVAVASAAWGLSWLLLGKEGPFKATTTPAENTPTAVGDDSKKSRRSEIKRALLSRTSLGLFAATFPVFGLTTVILSWMPAYLEGGLGFTTATSGFIFALPAAASLVCMLMVGSLGDRLLSNGRSQRLTWVKLPVATLVVGAVLIMLVPFIGGENRIIGLVFLIVGFGLVNPIVPISFAAVGTIAGAGQRTVVLSIFVAVVTLSGVIAPWLTGIAVDLAATRIAGYNMVFVVISVVMIAGGLVAWILANPDRDAAVEKIG